MADPDYTTIAAVAERYAPVVVLHADDKLRPSSADWFLDRSLVALGDRPRPRRRPGTGSWR